MKIYHGTDHFQDVKNPVVTVGTFDGVHLGHKKIITRLVEYANSIQGESVLVTFSPHPRSVLFPDNKNLRLLNSQEEKQELIRQLGVNHMIILPFTKAFAATSFIDFVKDFLVRKIHTNMLIVGSNHQFGHEGKGDFSNLLELAKQYHFDAEQVVMEETDQEAISSSAVRKSLSDGNIIKSAKLLGYDYNLTGKVVYGNQVGRTIGFPTANIKIDDPQKTIPGHGAYAVRIKWKDNILYGMLNTGIRPTIDHHETTTEVHIFDFNKDIYNDLLTIFFVDRIRSEIKFTDLNSLRKQLLEDQQSASEILDYKIISPAK